MNQHVLNCLRDLNLNDLTFRQVITFNETVSHFMHLSLKPNVNAADNLVWYAMARYVQGRLGV